MEEEEPRTPPRSSRKVAANNLSNNDHESPSSVVDGKDEKGRDRAITPNPEPPASGDRYYLRSANTPASRNNAIATELTPSKSRAEASVTTGMASAQVLSSQLANITTHLDIASNPWTSFLRDPDAIIDEMVFIRASEWHMRARKSRTMAEHLHRSFATPTGEIIFYDGFETTWFIPTDTRKACPPERAVEQRDLEYRRLILHNLLVNPLYVQLSSAVWAKVYAEVKHDCTDMWDGTLNATSFPLALKRWEDVRGAICGLQLLDMMTETRIRRCRVLLPGYLRIKVVDLCSTGTFILSERHIPNNVDLGALVFHLDMWDPAESQENEKLISLVRQRVQTVVDSAQILRDDILKQGRKIRAQLQRSFYNVGETKSERHIWSFRFPRAGQSVCSEEPKRQDLLNWRRLVDDAQMEKLRQGMQAGKCAHLVRVRISMNLLFVFLIVDFHPRY